MRHIAIKQIIKASLGVTALLIGTAAAIADENEERPDRRERGEPPQAALEACAAAVEGDSCTVETDRADTISGSCAMLPRAEVLVCVPKGGPNGRRGPGKLEE